MFSMIRYNSAYSFTHTQRHTPSYSIIPEIYPSSSYDMFSQLHAVLKLKYSFLYASQSSRQYHLCFWLVRSKYPGLQ